MDRLLLINFFTTSTTKGDASQTEAFPFLSIPPKEWEKKADEALAKSVDCEEIGCIPSLQEVYQSVMDSVEARPYHKSKTFLTEVPRKEGVAIPPQMQQEVWFVPLMFILFWGFGMVLTNRFYYIIQAIREFFYPKNRSDVFSERITDEFGFKSAMIVLSFCTISLFCLLALNNLFHLGGYNGITAFFKILAIFIGYTVFKILSTLYMCSVFFERNTFSVVRHSYATLVFTLCSSLFPIVLIASFTAPQIARYALIVGCIFCGAAVILYLYKILSVFFNGLTSIFYLFLYLCTLEILPIAALVGLLLG